MDYLPPVLSVDAADRLRLRARVGTICDAAPSNPGALRDAVRGVHIPAGSIRSASRRCGIGTPVLLVALAVSENRWHSVLCGLHDGPAASELAFENACALRTRSVLSLRHQQCR